MSEKNRWQKNSHRIQASKSDALEKVRREFQSGENFRVGSIFVRTDFISGDTISKLDSTYGRFDIEKMEVLETGKARITYRLAGSDQLVTFEDGKDGVAEARYIPVDETHDPSVKGRQSSNPPRNAEYLLHLLLSGDDREAVIGDLIERFAGKCERFGERKARIWFYGEVLRSLWPLLKRLVAKTSGFIALGEWIRRHVS